LIQTLFFCVGIDDFNPADWRLFIDSTKKRLQTVLFHNYKHDFVPVGHSVDLKETYDNIQILLTALKYKERSWLIFGYTLHIHTYVYILCEWDTQKRKEKLIPGSLNVIHAPLVFILNYVY